MTKSNDELKGMPAEIWACPDGDKEPQQDIFAARCKEYSGMVPYVRKDLAPTSQWRSIDSWPRDGTRILLCVDGDDLGYKAGSLARVIGYYAPKFTLPAHEDCDPESHPTWFEYSEEHGEYFSFEGFFVDAIENQYGDEIAKSVKPTHWMHLPPLPASPTKDLADAGKEKSNDTDL